MTQILAYIFYFVAASASPLQRRWLAKNKNKENTGQIAFAFQVAGIVAILSLLLPLFQPIYFKGNILSLIWLWLICWIFWAGYFIFSYGAQKHVEAGVSSLVSNIYTPITILLATMFLHESLTMVQIFWTCLLLVWMVIVSKKHRIGKFKFDKYFLMMMLSGVLLGVSLTAERALQKITGFTAWTMISRRSQFIFLWIVTIISHSRSIYSPKDIAITGSLRFWQSLSRVILIFSVWNLSLVSAITTFKIVILFVAAAIFLREREDMPRKIIGSIIAVIWLLFMK